MHSKTIHFSLNTFVYPIPISFELELPMYLYITLDTLEVSTNEPSVAHIELPMHAPLHVWLSYFTLAELSQALTKYYKTK